MQSPYSGEHHRDRFAAAARSHNDGVESATQIGQYAFLQCIQLSHHGLIAAAAPSLSHTAAHDAVGQIGQLSDGDR